MKRSTFLIAIAIASSVETADAQITPIGSLDRVMRPLTTLRTAGIKLMDQDAPTTINIINLDLTPYASLSVPALPAPYLLQGFDFVTEDLFDTDPSTIEYLMHFNDTTGDGPSVHGIAVYREDGTELFFQNPAWPCGLLNTPNGTIMLLDTNEQVHIWGEGYTVMYQLPGVLPCQDCAGNIVTQFNDPGEGMTIGGNLLAFPNPSNDAAQVEYTLPAGAMNGELVLHALNGQLVKRIPLNAPSGRIQLSTSILPAATYTYQIIAGAHVISGQRLIVVH